MATVNFNCTACGKLMAVSEDHLGKRVRCPHCQQAIAAPLTRPATAPIPADRLSDPAFYPPQAALSESIFEESDTMAGDDLFGGEQKPLVEMPPELPATNPDLEIPALDLMAAPPAPASPPMAPSRPPSLPEWPAIDDDQTISDQGPPLSPGPGTELTVTYLTQEPVSGFGPEVKGGSALGAAELTVPAPPASGGFLSDSPSSSPNLGGDSLVGMTGPARTGKAARPGSFIPTLLIFLIPYSIVITIAAVMLFVKLQNRGDPLQYLPDPKPNKNQGGPERIKDRRVNHELPISKRFLVDLNDRVEIGDLAVMPISVLRGGAKKGLSLTVRLKNISGDLAFNPVSQEFNKWDRMGDSAKDPRPYTFLEIGEEKVYGGAWHFWDLKKKPIAGRLNPDEEMIAVLTTDPRDEARIKSVDQFEGQLVWRIQVRRGLVSYKGKEYSATGVVGVVFKTKDVTQAKEPADE